jgi:hypothetical protein
MLRLVLLGGLLLPLSGTRAGADERRPDPPPNIVFVLVDDLGWTDVNPYSPQPNQYYETPNVTRLAALV